MIGCIDVEFRPSDGVVPRILGVIGREGYTIQSLRLIPSWGGASSTLKVNIGTCRATPEVRALADQILLLDETIAVTHGARVGAT